MVDDMRKSIHTADQELLQALLKDLRVEAGLRQVDLAERLGTAQSFISKYEAGERRLDLLEIRTVCHALGVTIRDFVTKFEGRLDGTE